MKTQKLIPNVAPKKRRTREDWLELVNAWETSGLTQRVYCQQQSLCLRQFVQWRCRFKKDNSKMLTANERNGFIPVQLSQEQTASAPRQELMTITLPNKISLSFAPDSDVAVALSVIKQLVVLPC